MRWVVVLLAACGSSSTPSATTTTTTQPVAVEPSVETAAETLPSKADLAAAHRELEKAQQEALAANCPTPPPPKQERCLPSCYATEPPDVRAGKKLRGVVAIQHLACEQSAGSYVIADELIGAKLVVKPARGRIPKKSTPDLATLFPKLPKGDVVVGGGAWRDRTHPLTNEQMKCAMVTRYARRVRALDGCGGDGSFACEATGNQTARAINVVHYRLAEARRLQGAGKTTECQQAALEAIAVARGLPRWRQYVQLNINKWVVHAGYRTRFDGVLDEDTLFATTARLGTDAEAVYQACGGGTPKTTADQEQSFHTCW